MGFLSPVTFGIMGNAHAQARSSNLLLEKLVNHFKHSNLRHGTCNQKKRGQLGLFCFIAQLYDASLVFHLHVQHGNLWNLCCHSMSNHDSTVLLNSVDPGLAFKHLNDSRF